MNTRIKQLVEHATKIGVKTDKFGGTEYTSVFDKEKFAELIVKECVNKIGDEYKDALDDVMEDWDRGFLSGLSCAMDTVQKHFGVKE